MSFSSRKLLSVLSAASLGIACAAGTAAAADTDYPTSPVTLVVPYAPGGTTDIVARIVAAELSNLIGQSVVVQNKSGAGGVVGTDYVARQKPDGYTLVTGNIGPMATSPALFPNLPYDPVKDLKPIRNIIGIPNVILVRADSPLKTIQDLLDYKESEPLFYASSGTSTSPHLTGEMFALATGVPLEHVSYQGSAPAITDLLAGNVPMMFDNLPASIAHVQAGKLRALAVTTENRIPLLPDVPTLVESGVKDFVVTGWSGLYAPANTPDQVINFLYENVEQVLQTPKVRERITSLAAEIPESNPQQFAQFLHDEIARWSKVIKDAKITVN